MAQGDLETRSLNDKES